MLRFAVFDDKGPADSCPLVNAHLLGPEDVGVEGDIYFKDGEIVCVPRSSQATGLSLQYNAGPSGILVLQTCLLPSSDQVLVLSHELARHRIKTFLVKCEEWQMFELSADHPAILMWEEARKLFTLGLNEKDPVKMDKYGRDSLCLAIESTERLAMAHAEVLLHRRYGNKPASSTTLGVRISPRNSPEDYSDLLSKEFDVLYLPLSWKELEPNEGQYDWDPIDKWMRWANKHGRPVIAGPLIDFSACSLPQWMYVWQHDYDTCRDLVYDHIERVVARYQNVVSIWSIAAGLNTNENFQFTPDQMLDLTRMGSLLIRQGHRRSRVMLEIVKPFGEHVGKCRDSIPPLTYIDRIFQEGIKLDCFGLQLGFGSGSGGLHTRDLMQVSHMLDKFFLLELPVLITRIGVPSYCDGSDAGYWQEPWSEHVQARWTGKAFGIVLSKPHVESFFWAELKDRPDSELKGSGLYDEKNNEKAVLKKLTEMRRRLRKPIGPFHLPTGQ